MEGYWDPYWLYFYLTGCEFSGVQTLEFIPIKSSVATASGAPGSCAGHSRVP
jgi:hypothetical protein